MSREEEIANIIKDNVHFVPQVDGYMVHGAVAKLIEMQDSHAREMSIGFKKWCDKNIAMKNKDGEFIVTTFSGLDYNKTYTLDQLYTKYLETLNKKV